MKHPRDLEHSRTAASIVVGARGGRGRAALQIDRIEVRGDDHHLARFTPVTGLVGNDIVGGFVIYCDGLQAGLIIHGVEFVAGERGRLDISVAVGMACSERDKLLHVCFEAPAGGFVDKILDRGDRRPRCGAARTSKTT